MTREEAKAKLLIGETLSCDYLQFNKSESYCWSTIDFWNGETEYECCHNMYTNIEEALEDIEHMCKGDWSEVI